jgi:uncharacterized protein
LSFQHPSIAETADGVVLTIHAQPNAKCTEFAGVHGDALKIRLASPPADGAANEALCRFLSEQLGVPMSQVIIRAGHGSRRKRVLVRGVTAQHTISIFKFQKAE